ncbi:ImmA/IrrE family metallo-endopeptidase [Mycetocola spongiae]|uniref:ImmA/IrrE family metallo-endopeptidase n=1 Tax=Mycetocola spongiae TaxID=2859226 RepID=UPI001CF2FF65|nr:ImmA/IrrE family metallo-endopeptidase [Mycetocola spongiae]UCR89287.1 hypothetical protein KXZ72_00800 [Mycetocola spongiae]
MQQYDPWNHAEKLGVSIIEWPLRTAKGMWVPEQRAIFIRPKMRSFVELSVLAHELVHAEYCDPAGHHPKNEARANRIAAQRLINPREIAELLRLYPDGDRICRELGVTREIFQAYLDTGEVA